MAEYPQRVVMKRHFRLFHENFCKHNFLLFFFFKLLCFDFYFPRLFNRCLQTICMFFSAAVYVESMSRIKIKVQKKTAIILNLKERH